MNILPSFSFYGLKVSTFTYQELTGFLNTTIRDNKKISCYGYSLGIIPYIKAYPVIYELGEHSELLVTDGRPFYILLRLLKFPVQYEISIPGLTTLLLELANKEKYTLLLFGGTVESNKKASENIKYKYSNINVLEGIDGYFPEDEEPAIVEKINSCNPNILLIGMSSPKKDHFTVNRKKDLKANIIVPCGGMIEVYAGNIKNIPKIVKVSGFASLYRLMQEPGRLLKRYMFIYSFLFFRFLPVFIFKVIILRKKDFSIPEFCDVILKNNIH